VPSQKQGQQSQKARQLQLQQHQQQMKQQLMQMQCLQQQARSLQQQLHPTRSSSSSRLRSSQQGCSALAALAGASVRLPMLQKQMLLLALMLLMMQLLESLRRRPRKQLHPSKRMSQWRMHRSCLTAYSSRQQNAASRTRQLRSHKLLMLTASRQLLQRLLTAAARTPSRQQQEQQAAQAQLSRQKGQQGLAMSLLLLLLLPAMLAMQLVQLPRMLHLLLLAEQLVAVQEQQQQTRQ
jgi:hypothetical protein